MKTLPRRSKIAAFAAVIVCAIVALTSFAQNNRKPKLDPEDNPIHLKMKEFQMSTTSSVAPYDRLRSALDMRKGVTWKDVNFKPNSTTSPTPIPNPTPQAGAARPASSSLEGSSPSESPGDERTGVHVTQSFGFESSEALVNFMNEIEPTPTPTPTPGSGGKPTPKA